MQPARSRSRNLHGGFLHVSAEWAEALSGSELKDLGNWQHDIPGVAINHRPEDTSHVYRVETSRGGIIFKRYRPRSMWRYFLRPSRAANEWDGLQAFESVGIPVPPLIAYGEKRLFGCLEYAFIITGEITGARDLASYAGAEWVNLPVSDKSRMYREIEGILFEMLRKAHSCNLYHQDLVWRNILVRKQHGRHQLWFIDCPRFRRTRQKSLHAELVDLSGLSRVAISLMSRSRRFRALLEYFEYDRGRTRKAFREIDQHHRRSRHPPRMFDPRTGEYHRNPDYF